VKKNIQEVNWSRKNQQGQVGDRLKQLESSWVGLVSKNYEIEQAVINMEQEYGYLKQQHTHTRAAE
jgi:pre-mRNA-splicing factor SPF27